LDTYAGIGAIFSHFWTKSEKTPRTIKEGKGKSGLVVNYFREKYFSCPKITF
jgi:hypothetical protein